MNNEEYWRQRFKQLETLTYNKSQDYYKRIIKLFNITETKLKEKINEFFSRFASLEDISIAEAKKVLEADELEAFHMSVEQYIQYGIENNENWNPDIDKLMEEASIKYRVTWLEAAFYQFAGEIGILTNQEIGELYKLLSDVYIDRYYRTAFEVFQHYGVGTSFEMIDMNRLEMILDQPWAVDGTNFSSRLWSQQSKLVNQLSQALTQACVRGEGYTETTEYLARLLNTSKSNAGRLVVTESAYFASRAQNSCYDELGAEQFEIIATLDNLTDPECQDLDGKVYDMSEFEVGVTAPPFHPNCRCTTVPYFDDSDVPGYVEGTRTARDPGGKTYRVPRNMKYSEWREKYNINPKYGTSEPEENSSIVLESPNNQSTINSRNSFVSVINSKEVNQERKALKKSLGSKKLRKIKNTVNKIKGFNPRKILEKTEILPDIDFESFSKLKIDWNHIKESSHPDITQDEINNIYLNSLIKTVGNKSESYYSQNGAVVIRKRNGQKYIRTAYNYDVRSKYPKEIIRIMKEAGIIDDN